MAADLPLRYAGQPSSHLAAEVDRHLCELNELLRVETSQNVAGQPTRPPVDPKRTTGTSSDPPKSHHVPRDVVLPLVLQVLVTTLLSLWGRLRTLSVRHQPRSPLESNVIQSRLNYLRQRPPSPQLGTRLPVPDDDEPPPLNEHDHSISGTAGFDDIPTLSPVVLEAPLRSTSLGRVIGPSSKAANLPPPLPSIAELHLPPYTINRSAFLESIGQGAVAQYEDFSRQHSKENANFGDGSAKLRDERSHWNDHAPIQTRDPSTMLQVQTEQNDPVPGAASSISSPMAAFAATFEKQVTAYQGAVAAATANVPETLALLPPSAINKSGI
ncbi:hypothetical protein BJ742DRAFT_887275 [Cladochytrium replicatum]|nr:hypothetical protein BJ742DRAFT_887275 [Cladochytrium replicatum]